MNIDIILPYKEIFSPNKASAVSLTVHNSLEYSEYKSKIAVFGQFTENSFKNINFKGIKTNKFFHLGKNRSILINYFKLIKNFEKNKRIIEIHNRPYIFNLATKMEKNYPICLHFHNDPRKMLGSKTVKERIFIAEKAAAVFFVSKYIKECFLEDIKSNYENLHIIPNAIQRTNISMPNKKKKVLFIGRLVPEKGCHFFINSIRSIVKKNPDWNFIIIGTSKAGNEKLETNYEKKNIKTFLSLGSNTEYLGFIPNLEVRKILEETAILVVPSIWHEPFALTALEGICSGSAVIASKVGGMKEILLNIGLLIDDINESKLKKAISTLIENPDLLKKYQNKSWQNYQFNQTEIVKIQDNLRKQICNNFYSSNVMKICIARVDRMGDMILTLPIIKGLKILNKSCVIHVIASDRNFKIGKHFNYIDKIYHLSSSKKNFFSIINKIRKEKYDHFYNFSPNWSGFILGILSKSKIKSTLIFLSRYRKNHYRKIIRRFLVLIFYHYKIVVDRFTAIKNNQNIHQTSMMFSLIKKNNIKINEDLKIDYFFPLKYNIVTSNDVCILHLSSKWINKYYDEENFIDLITQLQQKKILVYLTSDETTKNKFKKIFYNYPIVKNDDFFNKQLSDKITIFENLNFDKWIELIYLSKYVITPECGCTHLASLCKNKLTVIYDPDNFPGAIIHEYAPWKVLYNKLIFDDRELNQKIVSFIQ